MSQSIFLNSYISGWLAAQTWMVICNLDSRSLEKHARGAEVVINVRKCLTEGGKREKGGDKNDKQHKCPTD